MSTNVQRQTTKRKGSPKKKDSPKRMRRDRGEAIRDGMEDAEGEGDIGVTMLTESVSTDLLYLLHFFPCVYRSGYQGQ